MIALATIMGAVMALVLFALLGGRLGAGDSWARALGNYAVLFFGSIIGALAAEHALRLMLRARDRRRRPL